VVFDFSKIGGDEEDRTLDLTDANRTLSQLSYAPKSIITKQQIVLYIIYIKSASNFYYFFKFISFILQLRVKIIIKIKYYVIIISVIINIKLAV
jgi:hypothetical protein